MSTPSRCGRTVTLFLAATTIVSLLPAAGLSDEAKGNLVWIDQQNSALLLECIQDGCPTIPNAKTGETYTFVIPETVKPALSALKEGQEITLVYEETEDKAYRLVAVK